MTRLRFFIRYSVFVLFGLWLVGQFYRDSYWLTGLAFYIPTAIVIVAMIVAMVTALIERNLTLLTVFFVCSILPVWFVISIENQLLPRAHPQISSVTNGLSLVHWNIKGGNPKRDMSNVHQHIQSVQADIIVLSDAPFVTKRLQLDGKTQMQLGRMAIYAQGELREINNLSHGPLSSRLIHWRSPKGEIILLLADLQSSIRLHRAPHLIRLSEHIHQFQPDLVVGDLNAPRRSTALAQLEQGYTHAYDVAGSGWSYTWPWPLPVYAIDHCLIGPDLTPIQYTLHSNQNSDHRLQQLTFSVKTR